MSFSTVDRRHMARALSLAARGLNTTPPNPRVGCVIARGDEIVSEGWHVRAGGPHAEVDALSKAGVRAQGATAYVTLEPCCHEGRTPPCTQALRASGIGRVVYAAADPNPRVNGGGEKALRAFGIDVAGGLLAAEAERLNPGFMLRMRRGWPLVRTKVAASLDGRTALSDGRSQWITGEAARRDVQRYRARSSAIMTGVNTVLRDDPRLTVRDMGQTEPRQPLRVILDSRLRTPPQARILAESGDVLIFAAGCEAPHSKLVTGRVHVETVATRDGRPDLPAVLQRLAELECNEVWVEAGPTLNGELLNAGLVDELVVYFSAKVLGGTARGMFDIAPLPGLTEAPAFRLHSVRPVGDDLRLLYTPLTPPEKTR